MADQARWFKLWVSAPSDDALQRLEPSHRWAWAVFGCYTKLHGTHGAVEVSPQNAVLAAEMGVTIDRLIPTLKVLPHVTVTETQNRNGEFPVTVTVVWRNWAKYQEDSTGAARQKMHRASRSKKRREEMRGDKKRREKNTTPPLLPLTGEVAWPSPEALVELYNTTAPDECPEVTKLSPARRKKATAYLAMFPDRPFWEETCGQIRASRFLRGLRPSNGHERFVADFDWLLTKGKDGSENCVKVYEGKYHD